MEAFNLIQFEESLKLWYFKKRKKKKNTQRSNVDV